MSLPEERLDEIRAVLNRAQSVDIDTVPLIVASMAYDLLDEVDRLRAKHAALRADVERERGNLAQAGSTYAILRLDGILDHDDERSKGDNDE